MAAADAVLHLDGSLAVKEKAKLRRVLGRLDLVLFTACAIVGLDSVAQAAEAGAQAITWLAISLVLFLIPYGMLTAELGISVPGEGGPVRVGADGFRPRRPARSLRSCTGCPTRCGSAAR